MSPTLIMIDYSHLAGTVFTVNNARQYDRFQAAITKPQ